VTSAEQLRERNRQRWRRRRRRQLVALLLLVPLLVGAGILSSNVVHVLGSSGAAIAVAAANARPRAVPASGGVAREHLHRRVPLTFPVTDTNDLIAPTAVRMIEPAPTRFYQPGSHISPTVKSKQAQLRRLSQQRDIVPVAMSHRPVQAAELNFVDAVFQPTPTREIVPTNPIEEFWAVEQLYLEVTPPGGTVLGSTPIPEPGTGVMMSVGLALMAAHRRARLRRAV